MTEKEEGEDQRETISLLMKANIRVSESMEESTEDTERGCHGYEEAGRVMAREWGVFEGV